MVQVASEWRLCGAGHSSFYAWKEKNPDFQEFMAHLEDQDVDDLENDYDTDVIFICVDQPLFAQSIRFFSLVE